MPTTHSKGDALMTYNNVLIESFFKDNEMHNRVLIPHFGEGKKKTFFDEMDDKTKEVYQKAGFEVVTIDSGFERMFFGGLLNCSLQEIR